MRIAITNIRVFGHEDATSLIIEDGRIEKITSSKPHTEKTIDGNGALLIPGFCDTHTHLENIAMMHRTLDLTGMKREEIISLLKEECKKRKIVVGRGWDESFWDEKRYLTAEEIDPMCPDSRVLLIREDGHMGVVNSKMKREYGIGNEEGHVFEKELEYLSRKLKLFDSLNFEYAMDYALSKGITCVHDFATINTFKRYMELHRLGKLRLRIFANFYSDAYALVKKLGLHTGFGDEYLRIGGLKIFADGSIGAGTAATTYADGKKVSPILKRREIEKTIDDANTYGIGVFIHAIGDYAIEEITGIKKLGNTRIEHFELAKEDFLLKDLTVSMQPNFLKWAKNGGLYHRMLGERWLENNNPYRKIIESEMNLLFGSDCMPMDPLFGIKLATTSEYTAQKITFEEAVRAYTVGSRYMSSYLGAIDEGNLADLVVLDEKGVVLTLLHGRIAYRRKNLNPKWGLPVEGR